jgi:hypothetical protein
MSPPSCARSASTTAEVRRSPGTSPGRPRFEQVRELVVQRSAYQLKEADPHSWLIPRLRGGPKTALVEVQFDEYGAGDAARLHQTLYREAMEALELDGRPGAYLDLIPGSRSPPRTWPRCSACTGAGAGRASVTWP